MEKKEIQTKKVEVITDVICDCCGESCKVYEYKLENDERGNTREPFCVFEFMKLETQWGNHSGKDLDKWTAQVCEKCVDEKLSFINFKKE